jgi:general secretion pathway protein N
MVGLPKIIGVALLSGLILAFGLVPAVRAATSATLDILPSDITGVPERVEVGNLKPLAGPKRDTAKLPVSGNPLWSVPLSVLTATQERPIFSASRRPPPRAVAGPPVEPVNLPPPVAAEPDHPPLALIGVVVGDSDAIAVFLDRATQRIVRLRQGEAHGSWVLSSVLRREVTLKQADRAEVLALARADPSPLAAGVPGMASPGGGVISPAPIAPSVPVMSGAGYAPFTPRSTPKNGESDGL